MIAKGGSLGLPASLGAEVLDHGNRPLHAYPQPVQFVPLVLAGLDVALQVHDLSSKTRRRSAPSGGPTSGRSVSETGRGSAVVPDPVSTPDLLARLAVVRQLALQNRASLRFASNGWPYG